MFPGLGAAPFAPHTNFEDCFQSGHRPWSSKGRQSFGHSVSNDVGAHPVPCNLHVDVIKRLSPHSRDVTVS